MHLKIQKNPVLVKLQWKASPVYLFVVCRRSNDQEKAASSQNKTAQASEIQNDQERARTIRNNQEQSGTKGTEQNKLSTGSRPKPFG